MPLLPVPTIQPDSLWLHLGVPGSGKTRFLANLVYQQMQQGQRCDVVCTEVSPDTFTGLLAEIHNRGQHSSTPVEGVQEVLNGLFPNGRYEFRPVPSTAEQLAQVVQTSEGDILFVDRLDLICKTDMDQALRHVKQAALSCQLAVVVAGPLGRVQVDPANGITLSQVPWHEAERTCDVVTHGWMALEDAGRAFKFQVLKERDGERSPEEFYFPV